MRTLYSFRELILYRNKKFILDPIDKNKPKLGNMLVFISEDNDELFNFIDTGYWNPRWWMSYYEEKRMRVATTMNQGKLITQNMSDIYGKVKEKASFIKYTYLEPRQYQNKNLIYGVSTKFKTLSSYTNINTNVLIRKNIDMTLDTIHKDERFVGYKQKFYVIKIDDSKKIDAMYFNKVTVDNLVQAVIYRMFETPDAMRDYLGSTFIFTNTTGAFFYIKITEDFLQNKYPKSKFKRFLKSLYAYSSNDLDAISEATEEFQEDTNSSNRSTKTEIQAKKLAHKIVSTNPSENDINNVLNSFSSDTGKDGKEEVVDRKKEMIKKNPLLAASKFLSDSIVDDDDNEDVVDTTKTDDTELFGEEDDVKPEDYLSEEEEDELDEEDEDVDDLIDDIEESTSKSQGTEKRTPEDIKKKLAEDIKEQKRLEREKAKRDKKIKRMQEKSDDVMFGELEKNLKELSSEFENLSFEVKTIEAKDVINKSVKQNQGQAFTKEYYKKQMDATIAAVIRFFSHETDVKFFVQSVEKKDISDPMNSMWLYRFRLKDEYGKSHIIKFKIPKLVQGKFFYINGSKKMMNYQISSPPIIKLDADNVQVIGNLNKLDLARFGMKLDPKIELVKKIIKKIPSIKNSGVTFKNGDNTQINKNYPSILEYDELAKDFYSITISGRDGKNNKKIIKFIFNQHDIRTILETAGILHDDNKKIPVAFTESNEVIYIDSDTGKDVETQKYTISQLILSSISQYANIEDVEKWINSFSVPKKYSYSRAYFKSRKLALGVLLSYIYGFKAVVEKLGVKYELSPKRIRQSNVDFNQNFIKFADGYLYYNIHPIQNSLILNGIATEMDTDLIKLEDMESDMVYLDTFDKLFKTRHMSKAFKDAKIFFVDPILKQVLDAMEIPSDFMGLMLYANSMLEDNSVTKLTKMQSNRIRKLELIPVFLYKELVLAYEQYKYKYMNSKGGRFSIQENAIINAITASRLLNGYDILNPIRELENEGQTTYKGPGGCNVEDAYSLQRRSYDSSMVGVLEASTPDGAAVGITKGLTLNPRIKNLLGMVKTGDDDDAHEIEFGNMGSAAELLVPFAISHDDSRRLATVTKESKHMMAAQKTDRLLIGNGAEKTVPYMVSDDFIKTAEEDGKILDVDEKSGIAIIEYKSGAREVINIRDEPQKNSGMGFFILNKRNFNYKIGDKFKKGDVLVNNPSYFQATNKNSNPEYKVGTLSWVALIMSHRTYEDSSFITDVLAEDMAVEVVYEKNVVFGSNAVVHSCVNIGQPIKTGDPLIIYEDEIDDIEMNKLLQGQKQTDDLQSLEKIIPHIPRSKVTGVVQDIKVYYTVPPEEMSDSVRKVVNVYINRIKKQMNLAKKYNASNDNDIIHDFIGITRPTNDKIGGVVCPVGSVMVKIYTKYRNTPKNGDKIVFYAAMKTVIQRRLPLHLAPYPITDKERKIGAVLNPTSIGARMVTSMIYALYGNKCIWGLTEAIKKIYNEYAKEERDLETISKLDVAKLEDVELSVGDKDILNLAALSLANSINMNYEDIDEFKDTEEEITTTSVLYLIKGKYDDGKQFVAISTEPETNKFYYIFKPEDCHTGGTLEVSNEYVNTYKMRLYSLDIPSDKFNIIQGMLENGQRENHNVLPDNIYLLYRNAISKYSKENDIQDMNEIPLNDINGDLITFALFSWISEEIPEEWGDPMIIFDKIKFSTKFPTEFMPKTKFLNVLNMHKNKINRENNNE